MSNIEVTPCEVLIDETIDSGSIDLSKKVFKRYRLDPGDEVLVSNGGQKVRLVARQRETLKACQVATDAYLPAFMGVGEGGVVVVHGGLKGKGSKVVDAEAFTDVLDQPQERLEPLLGDELSNFKGLTVREVLEHIIRYGGAPKGSYLVVAPNAEDTGIPRGEACEDPSLHVKMWDPSGEDDNM